ncbi:hypothetical protein Ahy_A05g023718 [Arachis hypogaea]|uniref:Ubiquitin-like protease family profile domain-containing protein n=1 Tax=Arachis hypogaea TaxID=3818 RepID=A0A445D4A7_ARAHY|nr:hypothetical protein Ahy_A05g023718 [Arachis hypogaea]
MAFLLPTTINKISPMHLAPIFKMDTIEEGNWGAHVLDFIIKGITNYNLKKKKVIDGCLFALMIVCFHLSKYKDKKAEERPPEPWIANWTREQLVERMGAEMEEHMKQKNEKSAAQGEKEADLRSTEDHYVSSEIMIFLLNNIYSMFRIRELNLGSDDPLSQGHRSK